MPFFSVVIPLYNKEDYITGTLQSVLAQTFTDFEVIVVNDVSTDNSLEAAMGIKDSRIRFIAHDTNKGLSASRNTGIRNSKAEYVALIDADDLWKPGFLQQIHEMIFLYPDASLFGTRYEEFYAHDNIADISTPNLKGLENGTAGIVNYFTANLNKAIYCSSCICIQKNVFEKAGYYDESITFGEDTDFDIRANYYFKLAYCNKSYAYYIMHTQNQITGTGLKNRNITNYNKYEPFAKNRPEIKTFLDFHRYANAKMYRMDGDKANYLRLRNEIAMHNLNFKQRFLLAAPLFIVRMVSKIKKVLLKKGIVVNTYD